MSFHNTVIALLALLIVAVMTNEMRAQVRSAEHSADCHHDTGQVATPPIEGVRVVRLSRTSLITSLGQPAQLASILGLQSREALISSGFRDLASVAFGDSNHAVIRTADGQRIVVLPE